jgi:4-hydroxy-tetrahydrodipicolinate reductase
VKLNLFIFGREGRMGVEIEALTQHAQGDFLVVGGAKRGVPVVISDDAAQKPQVAIDFTHAAGWDAVVDCCVKNKLPLVSGTTGLTPVQLEKLETAGRIIPILWAPNMSLGVAFVTELLKQFSKIKDFDFQIEEIHHRLKKDSPSGTALWLQKHLELATEKAIPAPLAVRGGGVFGIHRIWALSDGEVITVEHQALSRSTFAKGALTAAKFLATQKPGVYQMRHVIENESK